MHDGQMALLEPAPHGHKPFKPGTQLDRVHRAMMTGEWRTLLELSGMSGVSLSTIGSRIRDLRKPKGHEHIIHVTEVTGMAHLHVYRMEERKCMSER